MRNDYEETFFGYSQEEIESEKKRRNALHAFFPKLMGGYKDNTRYVLLGDNIPQTDNDKEEKKEKEKKRQSSKSDKGYNYDPWQREKELDIFRKMRPKNLNGIIGRAFKNFGEYNNNEFEYINKAKFDSVINNSFSFEGGYSNNKFDRGGKTNYGITEIFMRQYKDALPEGKIKPIEELTKEDAYNMYFAMWNNKNLGQIRDKALAFVLNDYMINTSEWKVAKRVQRILNNNGENLKVDGIFGSKTLEAIHNTDKNWLIDQILIDRYNNYRDNVEEDYTQEIFYKGWIKRLNEVAQIAGSNLRFDVNY